MNDFADFQAVAQSIKRLNDRWELQDLVARYGRGLDDRDLELIADLYTSDATFESLEGPIVGRSAIIEYYRAQLARFTVSYHYPHSQTVEFITDDVATGVVQGHAELSMGGVGMQIALRYYDEYRREDNTWRFLFRRACQVYGLPMEELGSSLGDELRKRWPGSEPSCADLPESLATYRSFFGLDE